MLEQYVVIPSPARPRLLVPSGPAAAARGASTNYLALRGPSERAVRSALGVAARVGVAGSPHVLHVVAPADRPDAGGSLPLARLGAALGRTDLRASVGFRTGANRKATLQLVHADGTPAGYAKVGWNATTDAYVRTETAVLTDLAEAGTGQVKVPSVLASFDQAGHPVVVTEPLPLSVRGLKGQADRPSSAEMYDVGPISRGDQVDGIGQVKALRQRLETLTAPHVRTLAARALDLVERVAATGRTFAVAVRWHGDLTPWNTARDADGVLWIWDWESCEPDAPAGMDALHWAISVLREQVGPDGLDLVACLDAASPHLVAAGLSRDTWAGVAALYVATTVERTCALAAAEGDWSRLWISEDQLSALVRQAERLLGS